LELQQQQEQQQQQVMPAGPLLDLMDLLLAPFQEEASGCKHRRARQEEELQMQLEQQQQQQQQQQEQERQQYLQLSGGSQGNEPMLMRVQILQNGAPHRAPAHTPHHFMMGMPFWQLILVALVLALLVASVSCQVVRQVSVGVGVWCTTGPMASSSNDPLFPRLTTTTSGSAHSN